MIPRPSPRKFWHTFAGTKAPRYASPNRLAPQPDVMLTVTHAETVLGFVNEYLSYRRDWTVVVPGQAFGVAQLLTTPLNSTRGPVQIRSPTPMLPVMVGNVHVGRRNGKTWLPLAEVTATAKSMGVPHTNPGAVLTSKGTWLSTLAAPGAFGKGEFGCSIVTPEAELESMAEMPVSFEHPRFSRVTVRLLHSLKSMRPFPLPPEMAVALKAKRGGPPSAASKTATPPSSTTTLPATEAPHPRAKSEALTL